MTYAVVGRNVADTVATAIGQALEAAGPGDRVVFVDSESTDDSASVARRAGVPVLPAPTGKGAAVSELLTHHRSGPLCLLDGDIERSSCNFAVALRNAWREADGDPKMLVGAFDWPGRRELRVTVAVHRPLLAALFGAANATFGRMPLSGFRLLSGDWDVGPLPPGYGLEAHLNAQLLAIGGRPQSVELGVYEGPVVRRGSDFAREIGSAILDVAQAHGRLSVDVRPEWDVWVGRVADIFDRIDRQAIDLSEYQAQLAEATARPLPARSLSADARA